MKDIEKNSKKEMEALSKEETEKVSGGFFSIQGDYCCNVCCRYLSKRGGGIPLADGVHICKSCMEKYKNAMGDKAFAEWIKNPETIKGLSNYKWTNGEGYHNPN